MKEELGILVYTIKMIVSRINFECLSSSNKKIVSITNYSEMRYTIELHIHRDVVLFRLSFPC